MVIFNGSTTIVVHGSSRNDGMDAAYPGDSTLRDTAW